MKETVSNDCKVLALCSQKGGVGKTTSCVNLAVGLAREGKRVLVVDNDPQGSMTASLGYHNPDDRFLILDRKTAYHIGASLKDAGKKCFGINLIEDAGIIKDILQRLELETEE